MQQAVNESLKITKNKLFKFNIFGFGGKKIDQDELNKLIKAFNELWELLEKNQDPKLAAIKRFVQERKDFLNLQKNNPITLGQLKILLNTFEEVECWANTIKYNLSTGEKIKYRIGTSTIGKRCSFFQQTVNDQDTCTEIAETYSKLTPTPTA